MRALLSGLANTTELDVIGTEREIAGIVHSASFSSLNLTHVTYGEVKTSLHDPQDNADVLMLILPTGGTGRVQHKGDEFDISQDVGLMRDIRASFDAQQDHFSCFGLPLPISLLKQHVRTLIGEVQDQIDISFETKLDLSTPGGQHLRDTVQYIATALDGPLRNLDNPIGLDSLKDLLLTNILTLLPNSYSNLIHQRKTSGAVPYYVKRARDYIHAHAHTSITLEALANHAGCGYRTLQVAFTEAFSLSPMAYVTAVRLTYVREELLAAEDGISVTDIASKWGFTHMGRFSQSYQRKFGVRPSETLRSGS